MFSIDHYPNLARWMWRRPSLVAQVPLRDVVEPPDFEEFLALYQGSIERDQLRHLLEFPLDDVQVEVVRRKVRTVAPVIPERGSVTDQCEFLIRL